MEPVLPHWSDDKTSRLRQLWSDGTTGDRIAGLLGPPFTRNSVIAKARRLGLAGRGEPEAAAERLQARHAEKWSHERIEELTRRRAAGESLRAIAAAMGRGFARNVLGDKVKELGLDRLTRPGQKPKTSPRPAKPRPKGPAVIESEPVTIMQLTARTCRWPLESNASFDPDEFMYCGCRTVVGARYCSGHHAKSKMKPADRARARREWKSTHQRPSKVISNARLLDV